ncbi:hypothetical protein [Methylobacterium iners]|uniref:Uncharacterized protein n=1 Tax=Methylobacterium iners TaxID=418707 RepID=A0ABQ4RYV6_9HYPH|nr:hypothetical protein [Methylobacterium iners]GJD94818.1 hypothetical protein OCOJLMKI_2024 [Methylobacterium iners]
MTYDPFTARNLVSIFALAGLLVMMTEVLPLVTCIGIGLFCLLASGTASLFAGGPPARRSGTARKGPDKPRAPVEQRPTARPPQPWKPPAPDPAVEAHPAIFATVAGRTTGANSSRRR